MQLLVGTSGFSYKEWKGNFYPEKIAPAKMLSYYAERFSTVEINMTFRRFPKASVLESWAEQVPETFRFILKARQVITHFKRLQDVERETDDFLKSAAVLRQRQGPILFQLPPNFKKDIARLDRFLSFVGDRARLVFEFRHESWFNAELHDCLRAHNAAMCVADGEDLPDTELVRTADWGYLRLRREAYADQVLHNWIQKIESQGFSEVFVFFKHEEAGVGPRMAARFMELAEHSGRRS
jgi:uncharacterized protein YecE (DUF72 family)